MKMMEGAFFSASWNTCARTTRSQAWWAWISGRCFSEFCALAVPRAPLPQDTRSAQAPVLHSPQVNLTWSLPVKQPSQTLALRRLDSDSPASLLMISGPLMMTKKAPVSLATARAMRVLPEPGGPYSRIPCGGWGKVGEQCSVCHHRIHAHATAAQLALHAALQPRPSWTSCVQQAGCVPTQLALSPTLGGLTPMVLNSWGWRRGSSTSSRIWASCLRTPPTSS